MQRTGISIDSQDTEELKEMHDRIAKSVAGDIKECRSNTKLRRWRVLRQWMVLLADGIVEGTESAEQGLVGSVMLNVCRVPDTLLPPWPHPRPCRAYLSTLMVCKHARRCGVATSLIRAAERVARRWGFSEMWLHVLIDNAGALALYEGLGYERIRVDPWFSPGRRVLLKHNIAEAVAQPHNIKIAAAAAVTDETAAKEAVAPLLL